jgi:membrane fusion protein, heavy metal efflux system
MSAHDATADDTIPLTKSAGHPVMKAIKAVLGLIPTLVVVSAALAIGWWGHTNHWQMPTFAQLRGEVPEVKDWCPTHNIAESECVECDPSLMLRPKERGWCRVHGVAECVTCRPELSHGANSASVSEAEYERIQKALDFAPRPKNKSNCQLHTRRIQYATEADVDKSGIIVKPVWTAPMSEFLSAPGELSHDQTKVAHLSIRQPGSVWKVYKHLGDEVKSGDLLAVIDAAEVGKTKAELLQAMASLRLREQVLTGMKESSGIVSGAKVREAEAAVVESDIRVGAACQALTNMGLTIQKSEVAKLTPVQLEAFVQWLGLPQSVVKTLNPKMTTTNLLPLLAPMNGKVMSNNVVAGEVVDSTRVLFEIVDTTALWLTLDLKNEESHLVKLGQKVVFQPDNGQPEITGTLAWKNSQIDLKTRTMKVRANIPDPEQKLVANTFGRGRVILREEPKTITVPSEAVHWEGCCNVVFVRDRDYLTSPYKVFHVRKVRLGAKDEKQTEIIAGVLPGELVVTTGSGLLLTELLRGSLGEGCACCHPK